MDFDIRFVIVLIVISVIYFASQKVFEKFFPDASHDTIRMATKLTTMILGIGLSFLILSIFDL